MIRCRFKRGAVVHVAERKFSTARWETLCWREVDDDNVNWLHAWDGDHSPVSCQRCKRHILFQLRDIKNLLTGDL